MQPNQPVNPKDLRIGNWVNLYGKPKQIVAEDLVYLCGEYIDYKGEYAYIPLTPEILEKCGFELIGTDVLGGWLKYRNESVDLLFGFRGVHFYHGRSITILQFINEFQNLNYSLTGTELNINLCN